MTYTQLKQAIKDYTENDEATFVSNIDTFIANAENRISNAITLPDFKKIATGTMAIGVNTISIPADFVASLSLSYVKSGDTIYVLEKEADYLKEVFKSTSAVASPEYYAIVDDSTFQLAPTPDSAYVYRLHYSCNPESIVTAGTTWLGSNAQSLLFYGCLVEAAVFMKSEQDTMAAYAGLYQKALEDFTGIAKGKVTKDTYRIPDQRMAV